MAEPKTKKSNQSVNEFLNALADEQQRADALQIMKIMKDLTGEKPKMWGPSMIGFGEHHYVYASGHEGDMFRIGFAPRKSAFSLYLTCDLKPFAPLLKKLGKGKMGKGCLYIKKLADVDLDVLRELIERALAALP
jgi:Domain of unknown function (DU1801)